MAFLYTGVGAVPLFLLLLVAGCEGYVRVCYYSNWAQFRPVPFVPEDVDASLCTHIVFAFAGIQGTSVQPTEYNDEEMYRRLAAHRLTNPELKLLLSVGGWLAGGSAFSQLVSSEESMQSFVGDATGYLRQHGLDGLDVDWEFPANPERSSDAGDRVRFTRLLQLLREGRTRGRSIRGEQTAADMLSARQYYQIPQIARSVDYIHLMAYDFHGQWDLSQGAQHHSALRPEVRQAVEGWLQEGCPPAKLVLGVPAFARTFVLAARPRGTGVGQTVVPVTTPGVPANFSDNLGLLTYQQVCERVSRDGWQTVRLNDQQASAAYGNITTNLWGWAGYDDIDSITAKARFVKDRGLAGVMVWSMDSDDFNNRCAQGPWPLLTALKDQLPDQTVNGPEVPPTTPQTATTTTTTTTTTKTTNTTTIKAAESTTTAYNDKRGWLFPSGKTTVEPTETSMRGTVNRADGSAAPGGPSTPTAEVPDSKGSAGYRQCRISENFGSSLRCSGHHGKPGSRLKFYLYCFEGFFAIECACLPGFFYNRCIQSCDAEGNFNTCAFMN